MELILDLVLPRTDTAVLVQFVVVITVLALVLWRFWSKTELRLVLIGLGLVVLGIMGIRSLH